jgi:hypothetical protein
VIQVADGGAAAEAAVPHDADAGAAAVGTCIRAEHLSSAIEKCHPSTGQIEFMTKIAIDECDDDDLL